MTTTVAKVDLSPIQLAANESIVLDIIEDLLLDVSHDTSLTDDLVLAIQGYVASEGKDGNRAHDELGQLAYRAKLYGVFKLCGRVKNDPRFLDLVNKYTPELMVSGGNQMGTVVAVLSTITDTPQDILKAHKAHKGGKGSKSAKATKAPKVAKEKAPKPVAAKGSKGSKSAKAPESPLPMPQSLTWDEVKGISYRQLQALCKVFRSNGLFVGNIGGKGATKEALLTGAANAMRQLGYDIVQAQVSPQNPDTANPTLERHGMKYNLHCQATALLAA